MTVKWTIGVFIWLRFAPSAKHVFLMTFILLNPFIHFLSIWQHLDSKLLWPLLSHLGRRIRTSKNKEINGFLAVLSSALQLHSKF